MKTNELLVLPTERVSLPDELLVLRSERFSQNAAALFQELGRSPALRKRVLKDPTDILAEYELVGDQKSSAARISQANRLLFSLLSNPQFIEWGQQFQERMEAQIDEIAESEDPIEALRLLVVALDRGQLYREIAQATLSFAERETLSCLLALGADEAGSAPLDLGDLPPLPAQPAPPEAAPEGTDVPLSINLIGLAVLLVIALMPAPTSEASPLGLPRQSLLSIASLVKECLVARARRKPPVNVFDRLPHRRELAIMPTYQCTAECTHCSTSSSPREKTRLPLEAMLAAIDQAAVEGYGTVVFTGGEPTLAGKKLLLGIERAASHRLAVRIVTNACWAGSDEAAERRITAFVNAGLTQITLSTGDEHARFVPLENVVRGTRAAIKAGLAPYIMVETVKERRITRQTIESDPDFQRLRDEFPRARIEIAEGAWMPLSPSTLSKYPDGVAINASNLAKCEGCNSVLSTTLIEADGIIGACCGIGMQQIPELQTGNIRETRLSDADRAAADDFLKRWIRVEGPERILAWASTHDPAIEWENRYAHPCQACHRLYKDPRVRKVIADRHQEKIADVLFAEWLLFHWVPTSSG